MSIEDLKAVASGRVWTGTQAKENGLVDVLGGLQTAIEIAADKAELEDDFKVRYYPEQKTSLEQILEEFGGSMETKMARYQLGELYPYMDIIKKIELLKGEQARMPFVLEIR